MLSRLVERWKSLGEHVTLPDFIVIGAQKAGTSSLHACLRQHPQIVPSKRKELHFFDGGRDPEVDNYHLGAEWYRQQFCPRPKSGVSKVFETSPLYIFNPLAPRRIAELLPKVKLIALLRNPTERAISHYFHVQRAGFERLPIMDALKAEEDRLAPIIARQTYKDPAFMRLSYKMRGRYSEQLERYSELFPADQLLVLASETFFGDPASTLRRVFEFIGVNHTFQVSDLLPRNAGTNRSEVDTEVYSYLDDYFVPYNEALYRTLGVDYKWGKAS